MLTVAGILMPADGFGKLALVSVGYVLVISLNQALVSEPALVAVASGRAGSDARGLAGTLLCRSAALSVVVGGGLATVLSVIGLRTDLAALAAVVGLSVAGSICESLRAVTIGYPQRLQTLSLDAILFVGQVVGVLVALTMTQSLLAALLGWSVGPVLAAIVGIVLVRPNEIRLEMADWVRGPSAHMAGSLGIEAFAIAGSQFVFIMLVSALAGEGEAGYVRYALSVLGPISVLFNTFRLFALRWISARSRTARGSIGTALSISAMASAAVVVAGVVLEFLYRTLLSDGEGVVAGSYEYLWAAVFNKFAVGLCLGPTLTLRVSYRLAAASTTRCATAVGSALLAWLGLLMQGAELAFYLYSFGWVLQALILFALELSSGKSETRNEREARLV